MGGDRCGRRRSRCRCGAAGPTIDRLLVVVLVHQFIGGYCGAIGDARRILIGWGLPRKPTTDGVSFVSIGGLCFVFIAYGASKYTESFRADNARFCR